ncbi:hypothetical protein [Amycolatopsis benzoatilytica]|uniref:hypothetical protein n=1 Tax=Amycolatopsis benzoatilytica TaxID=346045 RepID=UPI0003641EEF|nr:hypothetical protein [Amycolatopsis benzoatilytica]
MQAWWLLVAVAAVFVVLALVFLRRAARRRSAGPPVPAQTTAGTNPARRLVSPLDDVPRRARHRLDDAHPLARYPVARQRPMPHPRQSDRQDAAREPRD